MYCKIKFVFDWTIQKHKKKPEMTWLCNIPPICLKEIANNEDFK